MASKAVCFTIAGEVVAGSKRDMPTDEELCRIVATMLTRTDFHPGYRFRWVEVPQAEIVEENPRDKDADRDDRPLVSGRNSSNP